MNVSISRTASRDLGRSLRFVRQARSLTLRDVATGANLSPQYVQNIELGQRTSVSEDAFLRLAKPLEVPEGVVMDLILRARIYSALEWRGLTPEQSAFVWTGVEHRLSEVGVDLRTDLSKIVADILNAPSPGRTPSTRGV